MERAHCICRLYRYSQDRCTYERLCDTKTFRLLECLKKIKLNISLGFTVKKHYPTALLVDAPMTLQPRAIPIFSQNSPLYMPVYFSWKKTLSTSPWLCDQVPGSVTCSPFQLFLTVSCRFLSGWIVYVFILFRGELFVKIQKNHCSH